MTFRLSGTTADRRHSWLLLALFGVLLTALVFYPGFINGDSKWQLDQARKGEYNSLHPPLMAWVWSYLDQLWGSGGGSMFLFSSALYWCGVSLLAWRLIRPLSLAALAALTLGLWPPLWAAQSNIVKDTCLFASLVFAAAMLLEASRRRSTVLYVVALIGLLFGSGVRHNGLTALPPLCWWAAVILVDRILARDWADTLSRRIRPLLLAAGLFVLLVGGNWVLANVVLKQKMSFQSQTVLLHDLVGISLRTDNNYVPAFYARGGAPFTLDELRHVYQDESNYNLFFGSSAIRRPGFVYAGDEYQVLVHAWLGAVLRHPAAYLRCRLRMMSYLLGLRRSRGAVYWFPYLHEQRLDTSFNAPWKFWLVRRFRQYDRSLLFRAWPYLAAILLAAGWALVWKVKNEPAFWSLAASAFCYELAYLVGTPSSDFRYSWYPVAVAIVLPLFLTLRRRRRLPWPRRRTPATSAKPVDPLERLPADERKAISACLAAGRTNEARRRFSAATGLDAEHAEQCFDRLETLRLGRHGRSGPDAPSSA